MRHLVLTQLFKNKVFRIEDNAFASLNIEDNKKAVVISSQVITSEQNTMLDNILKACKISKNDVQVIVIQGNERVKLQDVLDASTNNFVFFGIPKKLITGNFNYQLYKCLSIKNDKQLVFSNSFARLDKEVVLKKHLWNALKNMFKID